MDLHQHSDPDPEQEPISEELRQKLLDKAHELQMGSKASGECPRRVQVKGPHAFHHVHQNKANSYECMTCRVAFRFRKRGSVKRSRLLRP